MASKFLSRSGDRLSFKQPSLESRAIAVIDSKAKRWDFVRKSST